MQQNDARSFEMIVPRFKLDHDSKRPEIGYFFFFEIQASAHDLVEKRHKDTFEDEGWKSIQQQNVNRDVALITLPNKFARFLCFPCDYKRFAESTPILFRLEMQVVAI